MSWNLSSNSLAGPSFWNESEQEKYIFPIYTTMTIISYATFATTSASSRSSFTTMMVADLVMSPF